jgi:hypothetical protein
MGQQPCHSAVDIETSTEMSDTAHWPCRIRQIGAAFEAIVPAGLRRNTSPVGLATVRLGEQRDEE